MKTNHPFSDLKNKKVVITGGLGFMAKQYTSIFIKFGCKVILLDIKKKYQRIFKNIIYYHCDITNENEVNHILDQIIKKFGQIDILINNASIDHVPIGKKNNEFAIENFDFNLWQKDISVGLSGAFICSKIFGTFMSKQKKGGNIINISSDLGIISPDNRIYPNNFIKPVSYSVIKHGIIGLTKYVATYWASKNIRCNCFAPGGMYNNQNPQFVKKLKKLIPLNRMSKKNEYNYTIIFLASSASSYINGTTIIADGGRTIW